MSDMEIFHQLTTNALKPRSDSIRARKSRTGCWWNLSASFSNLE